MRKSVQAGQWDFYKARITLSVCIGGFSEQICGRSRINPAMSRKEILLFPWKTFLSKERVCVADRFVPTSSDLVLVRRGTTTGTWPTGAAASQA